MSVLISPEGKCYIACYGSLRRGMGNWHVNTRGNAKLIGLGTTKDNYNMYDLGSFPSVSLIHNSNDKQVVVEVYEAPLDSTGIQGAYDRLEGYPDFYNRTEVPVVLDKGNSLNAWIYHIDEEFPKSVSNGDWCLYRHPNYYVDLVESKTVYK